MANQCLASIQAVAMRVARLTLGGDPVVGAGNCYVTDKFTTLTADAEVAKGDEIEVKSAGGGICVSYRDCDRLKRLNVSLELCVPDPQLTELLVGGSVLTSGAAVGYGYPALNAAGCQNGVSIELWTKYVDSSGAQNATFPYLHWAFPRVYLQIGSKNFDSGEMKNPFDGFAIENPSWGSGPNVDWTVASNKVAQYIPVAAANLPTPQCGYTLCLSS